MEVEAGILEADLVRDGVRFDFGTSDNLLVRLRDAPQLLPEE